MTKERLSRALIFLAGSIVGGLALAFVIVAARPDLLRGTPAAPPAAPTAVLAPAGTYASAVDRASPAVANIYTARVVTERLPPASFGELFGDLLPRYRKRIENSLGSGVIVDARGHIVTNHHVIANADAVRVQLADGRIGTASVVGRDPDTDLAVLRVDLDELPIMPFGRSDQLRVGDVVLAIGNPIGLSQTVTQGIVSATGRGQLGVATFENFIQTDAPINFGNSGGALVNTNGELVGINTAVLAKNLGVEGIGFAIPVNLVRGVLAEIIDHGRVIRGWIGIAPEDISNEQAAQIGLPRGGVVITSLYVGGPAERAGMQPGDIVTMVGGYRVRSAQEVMTRIAAAQPGERLAVRVARRAGDADLDILVAERQRT